MRLKKNEKIVDKGRMAGKIEAGNNRKITENL